MAISATQGAGGKAAARPMTPEERKALDELTHSVREVVEAKRAVVETAAELVEQPGGGARSAL